MDKFDRIYAMHQLFAGRRTPIAMVDLCRELECSEATIKRNITLLRDTLGAPLFNVRGQGWCYDYHQAFELPGLWFNSQEVEALLAMHHLLSHVGRGVLDDELAAVRQRLEGLLARISPCAAVEMGRIRILDMGKRGEGLPHFTRVVAAVLERKRLTFYYGARSTSELAQREVSPQRLVHYRDNWYLDAYCHKREALRTFALERMADVDAIGVADDVDEARLNDVLASSYGIFSGGADQQAVLRFSAYAARWVANECWHPKQQGCWLESGAYELKIPYGDSIELIMDVCRYGVDVEVVAPQVLRDAVAERLRLAAAQYV